MDEEGTLSVPAWHLNGDWFDVCTCKITCPCTMAQAPTDNACAGVLAYHVRDGRYGDVVLDDLNVVGIVDFTGNVWAGESKFNIGLYVDDRADQSQQEALQNIFGGAAGGWPAVFAQFIGDLRGVEVAPINIEVDDDLGGWRCSIPGHVEAHGEALTGPTSPPGSRVQTMNPPGSEVGPLPEGGVVTWGRATQHHAHGFGFEQDVEGRSSKHIPFAWTGPDS